MTVSGGEILLQPAFVKELLGKGRDAYLHNAIETSGCGKWEDLKDMIDLTDVVFMDIKAVDPFLHKELTGVDNRVILENIKKAASYCQTTDRVFVLRLPLIPGCNDTEDNLKRTGQLACRLQTELNVLPYHNYGAAKYARIGKTYELSEVSRQSKEDLAKAGKILRQTGAEVTMGGYSVESY